MYLVFSNEIFSNEFSPMNVWTQRRYQFQYLYNIGSGRKGDIRKYMLVFEDLLNDKMQKKKEKSKLFHASLKDSK